MAGLKNHVAPIKSVKVSCKQAFDADMHAANLTNWQQEYDQISRGGFHGSIVELPFNDLQVFKEVTSQALQQKCMVWPDSVWLGIPLNDQSDSRINGLSVRSDNIMCRPGGCEFDLTTPQGYELYGMVVKLPALMRMAEIHDVELKWSELNEYGRLVLPEKTLQEVRFLLNRLLGSGSTQGLSARISHDLVMMALLEVLKVERPAPAQTQSYHHRKQVVDLARAFIQENPDTPLTVTDLCQVTNVSRRSIQYAFESILDISPIQYLRMSRLNGVRRALMEAEAGQNIADLAAQWGFWHMSQFAKDYRLLFGERPSTALSHNLT